jgi:hypothetical protein
MSQIKEWTISSMAEPVGVKIEKNSKGYNYEISLHGEDFAEVIPAILAARQQLEKDLGISQTQQVSA